MPVYWLALVDVTDREKFVGYGKLAPAAVKKYGGKVLSAGNSVATLEGEGLPKAYALVEFDTLERAVDCYNSSEYQAAKAAREGGADFRMVVLQSGAAPPTLATPPRRAAR